MSGRNPSFQRLYPPAEGTPPLIFFDGGLNTKFSPALLSDNESPDCLNVVFNNGAVQTRGGSTQLNTIAMGSFSAGSFVIDGLYTRNARGANGTETMVAFCGGQMYTLATTTFITVASAQSVWTAGVRVACDQAENYIFAGNGNVIPYKYNGTEFTRHGIYPPTATATAASNAVGVITGDYRYKYTFVNSNSVESDVSPVMGTFTAAAATIRLTITTAPISWGVNSRNIYRTVAGGTAYLRVGSIANNTATTFDDNNADSALGVAAPTDQGVPPLYNIITFLNDRLWVNDPNNLNYLWYSELGNPYVFKTTSFQRIGDNTSDLLRAIGQYANAIVAIADKSITVGLMNDTTPGNWKWIVSKSNYGTRSPFCLPGFDDNILFPAIQESTKFVGFAKFTGTTVQPDQTILTVMNAGSLLNSEKIEPDMFNVQSAYLLNTTGIAWKNKIFISLTYGAQQTTNNRIYVYDYSLSDLSKPQSYSWVPYTGLNASQFTVYGGNLYYGSSTPNGLVYQMETTSYNDNGAAINSYYYTKEFSGYPGEENNNKDFRKLQAIVDASGAYYMDLAAILDSGSGSGSAQLIDLTPAGALWDVGVWDIAQWGPAPNRKEANVFLASSNGKRIQFRFSNQNAVNQYFKVHWMKFRYNIKGLR